MLQGAVGFLHAGTTGMGPLRYFEHILGRSHFQSALPQWSGRQPRQDPADLGCAVSIGSHQTAPMTSLSPLREAITIRISGLATLGTWLAQLVPELGCGPSPHFLGLYPNPFNSEKRHIFIRL